MKFILCSIALVLLLAGCGAKTSTDKDSFQLTVEQLINDGDTQITVLKIVSPRTADMQVNHVGKYSSGGGSALIENGDLMATGRVLLSAVKVGRDTNWAAIQITMQTSDAIHHGGATGTTTYPVRPKVKLDDFFTITATDGTYWFFTPVKIATLEGEPVNLVLTNAP